MARNENGRLFSVRNMIFVVLTERLQSDANSFDIFRYVSPALFHAHIHVIVLQRSSNTKKKSAQNRQERVNQSQTIALALAMMIFILSLPFSLFFFSSFHWLFSAGSVVQNVPKLICEACTCCHILNFRLRMARACDSCRDTTSLPASNLLRRLSLCYTLCVFAAFSFCSVSICALKPFGLQSFSFFMHLRTSDTYDVQVLFELGLASAAATSLCLCVHAEKTESQHEKSTSN